LPCHENSPYGSLILFSVGIAIVHRNTAVPGAVDIHSVLFVQDRIMWDF
jgi:hypothetical protein